MVLVGFIAMLAACSLAGVIGGQAEREGSVALCGCWMVSLAFQAVFGTRSDIPTAVADLLYTGALLVLASRFDRSWVWVSLVLQVAVLVGHGLVLMLSGEDRLACVAFINVASFGTLLTLVLGAALNAYEARRGARRRGRIRPAGPRRA